MAARPDVVDWGILGETTALRQVNTRDPIDMERYWLTNQSTGPGLMVDDIETLDELAENAKVNGRSEGFTFAISGTTGQESGEFQGFVQFTPDSRNVLRAKIEETDRFAFLRGLVIWEVSYAKYPMAAPRQVASAVRQGCVLLLRKLGTPSSYPRVAIIGCVAPSENPASVHVLRSACFDAMGSASDTPLGMIRYEPNASSLDSVWLLNWSVLNRTLREKAAPYLEGLSVGSRK
jgi:hypothetical protein